MTTMLERAARALHAHWYENYDHGFAKAVNKTWDSLNEKQKSYAYGQARAVLMAIKEPDETLSRATQSTEGWEAMIDAILNEDNHP